MHPATETPVRQAIAVRAAARPLATADTAMRTRAIEAMADQLTTQAAPILAANSADMDAAREQNVSAAILDRLMLDADRLADTAAAVRDVAALPDPLGEVIEERTLDNGVQLRRIRVPFGLVGVVYEARPNVTADAAAVAIKTGNGILLRGSTMARHTNTAMVEALTAGLADAGLDPGAIALFDPLDKDGFRDLIATEGSLDLVIPRGGEGLKRFLLAHARVPVLAAAGGNCHVYVHADADPAMAAAIVMNAKTQRTGVCNAAETLLVHRDIADTTGRQLRGQLEAAGVAVHESEDAWATEYLDMDIAYRVVDSLESAIDHINTYGTSHSEAIITASPEAGKRFQQGVDAACVYVNASTRFTDGGVFGLGAEVGISTNKLHARGPIGPRELTTTKYLLNGTGQIRE